MMNLSVGFERILAEARKYNLVLAGLANQYVSQLDSTVRQAIFGNVGTMIVFRLGVDDAGLVSKEMGVFTAEEILDLDIGQCIVRAGPSNTAHNVMTYPEAEPTPNDPSAEILRLTRLRYARGRKSAEQEIAQADAASPQTESATTPQHKHRATRAKITAKTRGDPREDDLVQ
jgi:hypothetical protein